MEERAKRRHGDDLRAAVKLAILATTGVTDVVEEMHVTIGGGPPLLGRPLEGPVRLVTKLSYGAVRGVTKLVGAGLDRAIEALAPALGESTPGPEREAVLSALNGVLGDHLAATGSPLAIEMSLRCRGPRGGRRLLVLVHGSSMNDLQWTRGEHDHGAALARDLGYTPIYIRYNTGLHVSTNGRALASLLDALVAEWPEPIDEIAIVAHSMGGLVARSAAHVAALGAPWRMKLRRMVFLATPHHGSPLERSGNLAAALLGVTSYSAPLARLARIRSAGVTDLRHGSILDEDWSNADRFALGADARTPVPLPAGVECYAIAAERDALVPLASALGTHHDAKHTLAFPPNATWTAPALNHLEVLWDPGVYARLRAWLA
ncbi:MAG: alpha/beta fold hydrolase [Labilithrix sp.]|nr:alpha/beta fold hydrolase [Labilithrix sp.]MCW5809884.1 alpha/beta fold hydrolase [Labilithrix sp.]